MSAASNALENHILNHTLRGYASSYTPSPAANLKLALFTGAYATVLTALEEGTYETTAGNWGYYEVNNATYERVLVTFGNDATTGSISNTANTTFPTATADYDNTATSGSTVTCIAIVDESRSPNQILFYGQLQNFKEILNGDTFQVATGNLTISLA